MARVASFSLTRYPRFRLGTGITRVPIERFEVRSAPGLVVGKVLGTGRGNSTTLAADLRRWATFAVWEDDDACSEFLASPTAARWRADGAETWTVRLAPLAGARGRWGGVAPFEDRAPFGDRAPFDDEDRAASSEGSGGGRAADGHRGPVAVLTRASIRWRRLGAFYGAVPAVDRDLAAADGLVRSVGVGEWPVARQGTFSLWRSAADLARFAYRRPDHAGVVRRTRDEAWYAEELFARFSPYASSGTWDGHDPLAAEPG